MNKTQMSKLECQNHNPNPKTDIRYRSYLFSLSIIKFVSSSPQNKIYWTIGDQPLKAATSIGANIIEAKSSSSRKDFIKFYEIALKSANETKYWLCLIKDSNLMGKIRIDKLLQEAIELANMLASSLITLKGKT